jgi:exodeoxyribonuclease V alpha subunit
VNHRLTKNASKTNTQVDTQTPTQALSQALSVSNAEVLNTLFEHIKQGRTNEAIELIKTSSHHDKAAPISWIRLRHFKGLPEAQRAAKRALSSIFIDPKNDELFKEWHQARREANRSLRAEIVKLHLASHEEERDQLFQHIEAFFKKELILCAQYKGPLGVEHMNELFKKSKPLEGADQAQYIAHPLLILKNHSKTRLYNGDIGFLCEPRTSPDMSTPVSAQVYFEDLSDERSKMRAIPLSRLPAYDHVYAMSVHKSQGSEFREVTISLPAFPSPLLTRELFYTAITRTKTKVRLIASEEALKQAIESLTWRFTLGVSSSIGVESP